mmetsp:Transcript_40101/g.120909  ORF Transcript_40101/g.120909 Transcript_40101/m.120909 type:complete len:320 (+) Transcript_40101:453-1412(+)
MPRGGHFEGGRGAPSRPSRAASSSSSTTTTASSTSTASTAAAGSTAGEGTSLGQRMAGTRMLIVHALPRLLRERRGDQGARKGVPVRAGMSIVEIQISRGRVGGRAVGIARRGVGQRRGRRRRRRRRRPRRRRDEGLRRPGVSLRSRRRRRTVPFRRRPRDVPFVRRRRRPTRRRETTQPHRRAVHRRFFVGLRRRRAHVQRRRPALLLVSASADADERVQDARHGQRTRRERAAAQSAGDRFLSDHEDRQSYTSGRGGVGQAVRQFRAGQAPQRGRYGRAGGREDAEGGVRRRRLGFGSFDHRRVQRAGGLFGISTVR